MRDIWNDLQNHHSHIKDRPIVDLFDVDGTRFSHFSTNAVDMVLDYSKTNMDGTARGLLFDLMRQTGVEAKRDAMFAGEKINDTEGRAVLHTALRNLAGVPIVLDGADVMPSVLQTLEDMKLFSSAVRDGTLTGVAGKPFTDVVNIGIGGSDLGPVMATAAMSPYHDGPRTHFVSNVDGADIHDTLKGLNPETTLLIIASKTFTTIETMANAQTATDWMKSALSVDDISDHLVALSTAADKTAAFGVKPERVFGFEDWVGGRYSVWGPIGLSLMLAIGGDDFVQFLQGAHEMDTHFKTAPMEQNMPMALAMVGVWHSNICGYATRAVLPYEQRLTRLPAYLQQLDMESNGKGVAMNGVDLPRDSGPIVWGEPGTNGQHAFYQLIHQGTRVIPCEFMVAQSGHEPDLAHQHELLQANCLAQSEALMLGRSVNEARALMAATDLTGDELERQARHRVFKGSRPSTTLIYPKLTPYTLGAIIALYEHRVFVEGVIWGLNSFDQWGVELGKVLATEMQGYVSGADAPDGKDGSTLGLLAALKP
ncbi:glucose-6-phosphate isomerase [Amylibacter ulvae]|uniref:Glucose-6-phosphate isomerase n=1 Tax=Paramylibacter ulvae TaxID=1651968 RepID=A0ABQ3CVC9_9RHOB|nr:glucose-6-phosphate isomerase [Amylibacter ulvae]GHA40677.1 glucose-6-phosphate isomerase [Amylibacter ulvae]